MNIPKSQTSRWCVRISLLSPKIMSNFLSTFIFIFYFFRFIDSIRLSPSDYWNIRLSSFCHFLLSFVQTTWQFKRTFFRVLFWPERKRNFIYNMNSLYGWKPEKISFCNNNWFVIYWKRKYHWFLLGFFYFFYFEMQSL